MTHEDDPYQLLTHSIKALKQPLEELMKHHDEFLLQNVQIINNVNSISMFNQVLQEDSSDKAKR